MEIQYVAKYLLGFILQSWHASSWLGDTLELSLKVLDECVSATQVVTRDISLFRLAYHNGGRLSSCSYQDCYVQGGGWCSSISTCSFRKNTKLGSSKYMERQVPFLGILSHDPLQNPGTSIFVVLSCLFFFYNLFLPFVAWAPAKSNNIQLYWLTNMLILYTNE